MYLAGNTNISKLIEFNEIVEYEYYIAVVAFLISFIALKPLNNIFYEIDIITQFFKVSKTKKIKLDANNFTIEGFKYVIQGLADEAKKQKDIEKQLTFIETQKKERDYLQKTSENDPLTGLFNRRKFTELSDEAFKIAKLTQNNLSVMMCDIDHFKSVNDTYGHDVGDIIIKQFVEVITDVVQDNGVIARWGGEEFIVLIEDDAKTAAQLAEKIRKKVESFEFDTVKKKTASFGVSNINVKEDANLSAIVKRADDALYKSKEDGRNRVSIA